jgi:hypothetical protein
MDYGSARVNINRVLTKEGFRLIRWLRSFMAYLAP